MSINTFSGEHRFLSNFHEHEGWTVEHHFQAAKTDSPEWVARILGASTPGKAKRLGRQAPIRPTWEQEKIIAMLTLLRMKFAIPEMRELLLATGNAELIEGNTWGDTFWGVCNGTGANNLGKLLMQVRSELQEG